MLKNYYLRFFSILLIVLFMAVFAGAVFAGEANIIILQWEKVQIGLQN